MTFWVCDRCGKQVKRDTTTGGKYQINKKCVEIGELGCVRTFERGIKLCDQCSMEMEKFLDDEFEHLPSEITVSTQSLMEVTI